MSDISYFLNFFKQKKREYAYHNLNELFFEGTRLHDGVKEVGILGDPIFVYNLGVLIPLDRYIPHPSDIPVIMGLLHKYTYMSYFSLFPQ